MSAPKDPAHLAVVRGEPTAEEIAVLTAVLSARAAARSAERPEPERPPGWRDRSRALSAPLRPGPGAWRMSMR
ncbi:acyl-CoA carboxylase subunit epsilon [Nocardiopsis quinghaiensis]|uniref:acyl-CoA carboxylase subunit epsilon n=1 Tax=Nocardiopsis quinghaiensis TaxID=464995 RepID=UPI00123973B5|nr:acyl-CoA carboxylase subunit epsilon [Nocardiopsis quinghaiensis]